jgi:CxxC motif-containing protein
MNGVQTNAYLCIGCPLGCRLEVDVVEGDIVEIRGFQCAKGKRYARQEHTDPRRPVSSTVAITGGALPRLPVRTADAVPKALVRQIAAALNHVSVRAPVRRGDVVLANALDTGIDVIATRSMATPPGKR